MLEPRLIAPQGDLLPEVGISPGEKGEPGVFCPLLPPLGSPRRDLRRGKDGVADDQLPRPWEVEARVRRRGMGVPRPGV